MYKLDYRIPIVELSQLQGPHHSLIPLDKTGPEFYQPLVNLAGTGLAFESYHAKDDGNNAPYHHPVKGSSKEGWLRKSLVEKLIAANKRLEPYGVELLILDAYRSMECQRGLWAFFYERGSRELQTTDDEACTNYALRYVRDPRLFDPDNAQTFPIHATGASIDVTLRHLKTGQIMNMGSDYEEYVPISYNDFPERMLLNGEIDENNEVLQNRRLMQWALTMEGFQNDPILYWHYDWGNQAYIKFRKFIGMSQPDIAWYGYIEAPEWETENLIRSQELTHA